VIEDAFDLGAGDRGQATLAVRLFDAFAGALEDQDFRGPLGVYGGSHIFVFRRLISVPI
jgi:hypothetical protein